MLVLSLLHTGEVSMLSEAMRPLPGIYMALFLLYITFSIYALANVVTGTSSVKEIAVCSWVALVHMFTFARYLP